MTSQKKDDDLLENFLKEYSSPYNIKKEYYQKAYQEITERSPVFNLNDQVLFWFPNYLSLYKDTIKNLIEEENFIPLNWKYFIAIMAVSTIKCEYLLKQLEESFLQGGGDVNWLIHGLKAVPHKLQKLGKINNIIAHQPWKLNLFDFNSILSKENDTSNQWNINELMHAFLIIITYQKIANIIKAVGIKLKFEEPRDIYQIKQGKK